MLTTEIYNRDLVCSLQENMKLTDYTDSYRTIGKKKKISAHRDNKKPEKEPP